MNITGEEIKPKPLDQTLKGGKVPTTITGVPVNQFPVKEFVDCVKFIIGSGNVVKEVTAPDSPGGAKIEWTEYLKFLKLIGLLKDALIGIGMVPQELGDLLTEAEKEEILTEIMKLEYIQDNGQAIWYIDKVFKWLAITQEIIVGPNV